MSADTTDRLVLREYPIFEWLIGVVFGGVGIWVVSRGLGSGNADPTGLLLGGALFLFFGVLWGVLLASVNTVIVDKTQGTFTVEKRWLYRKVYKEYPISEIAAIDLERSRSRNSTTFRPYIETTSGEVVPLSTVSSSGYGGKAKKVKRLREFIGLSTESIAPRSNAAAIGQVMAQAQKRWQSHNPPQTGTTDGVVWQLETLLFGGVPVTRWVSRQFSCPGRFLMLAQKAKGSANVFGGGGGVLGGISQMVYRQLLSMYGFQAADTPGLESASQMDSLDPRLAEHFASLTSDQISAQQFLTPWVVNPLAYWADQHPLKHIQAGNAPGQLVVMFSPQGLYLALFNVAPQQADELIRIGTDMVRALVTVPPA